MTDKTATVGVLSTNGNSGGAAVCWVERFIGQRARRRCRARRRKFSMQTLESCRRTCLAEPVREIARFFNAFVQTLLPSEYFCSANYAQGTRYWLLWNNVKISLQAKVTRFHPAGIGCQAMRTLPTYAVSKSDAKLTCGSVTSSSAPLSRAEASETLVPHQRGVRECLADRKVVCTRRIATRAWHGG